MSRSLKIKSVFDCVAQAKGMKQSLQDFIKTIY